MSSDNVNRLKTQNAARNHEVIGYYRDRAWALTESCHDEVALCLTNPAYVPDLPERRRVIVDFAARAVTQEPRKVLRHGLLEAALERDKER